MAAKQKKPAKTEPAPDLRPGANVRARIAGAVIGPIYFVQIIDGKAELKGKETHLVDLEDLLPLDA